MPSFSVRFKGMLTPGDRERLAAAGIEITSREPSMQIDSVKLGRPIYTVAVEATTADEALAKVRDALEPDTANFTDWESRPTQR